MSQITAIRRSVLSPFATLVEKEVDNGVGRSLFHSLEVADYVNVLAILPDGRVAAVKQYRSTIDGETLELPVGLLEEGELPINSATRELFEETGLRPLEPPVALPPLRPEVGRLENTLCSLSCCTPKARSTAGGLRPALYLSLNELYDVINSGRFEHAGHLGVIVQAIIAGYLSCRTMSARLQC